MLYQSKNNRNTLRNNANTVISTTEGRMNIWLEHHKEQLNIITQADPEFVAQVQQLPINHDIDRPITRGELRRALRKMRKNKAPGIDGIEAEMLQNLNDTLFEQLFAQVHKAWAGDVPQ